MISYSNPPVQEIHDVWLKRNQIRMLLRREDLNHPFISGNKWWKLKYNLEQARHLGMKRILTFGGAFSNHLYATAAAAKANGLECIGVIRGEEVLPLNSTLEFAQRQGMSLHHVSREAYREKSDPNFVEQLRNQFGEFYLIPEGGTNDLAVKGCSELGEKIVEDLPFDYLCLPIGTGGTMAGLIGSLAGKTKVIGFSVLKNGAFLNEVVTRLLFDYYGKVFSDWSIVTEYHFGGYAKTNPELNDFILSFYKDHKVTLEPVYTGKMMFGFYDLVNRGFFKKGSTIMVLHTGGLRPMDQS